MHKEQKLNKMQLSVYYVSRDIKLLFSILGDQSTGEIYPLENCCIRYLEDIKEKIPANQPPPIDIRC